MALGSGQSRQTVDRRAPQRPGGQGAGGGRGNESGGREPEPTIDVSRIRFGAAIDLHLYSDIAEAAAREVGRQVGGRECNKPTQLRRFYDELVMLHDRVGSDAPRFEAQAPFIQMLKAKAAYALGRKKVDVNFERLLRTVVDGVVDIATLKQAKIFLEAFMAFYKAHGPRD